MSPFASFLFSLSVLLPLTIGLIRIRKIHSSYHPFLALIMLAALTELISYISIRLFVTNTVVLNIFWLLECMLILYQFYRWRFYSKPRAWFWAIPAVYLLIWIIENLIFLKIVADFSSVFRACYSFLVVMLSINEINYLITHENRHLFRNARFLICMGFIIYFLYQVLFEGAFYISTRESNPIISNKILSMSAYINALVNVIFGIAMAFIPDSMLDFNRTLENLQKRHEEN